MTEEEKPKAPSFLKTLSPRTVLFLGILIIIITYISVLGLRTPSDVTDVERPVQRGSYLWIAVAAIVVLVMIQSSTEETAIMDEQEAKEILKKRLLWKQQYSRGELKEGRVVIDSNCNLQTVINTGKGLYWHIGFTIYDLDNVPHRYVAQVWYRGRYAGSIKNISQKPQGWRGDEAPDIIEVSPDAIELEKKYKAEFQKRLTK